MSKAGHKAVVPNSKGIMNVQFNQDHTLFAVSFDNGFRVYHLDPLAEKSYIGEDKVGSVWLTEVIRCSNVIPIVGGGPNPKFASNVVAFWCDRVKKFPLKITASFPIKFIKARGQDRIAIGMQHEIMWCKYYFGGGDNIFTVTTRSNPKGLCDVSPLENAERQIMVFPGRKKGSVQIVDLNNTESRVSSSPVLIQAHQSELEIVVLNQQATRIATASEKGTLIRVWDSTTRAQLVELRRGTDTARIYCVNFSKDSEWLCASSDKGTIHIFALKDTNINQRMTNTLRMIGGQYCESQWAAIKCTLPDPGPCICAFGKEKSVFAVLDDGRLYKYVFNPDNLSCHMEEWSEYLNLMSDDFSSERFDIRQNKN